MEDDHDEEDMDDVNLDNERVQRHCYILRGGISM